MKNKQDEAYSLRSYQDGAVAWTIGYGHRGREVGPGMVITHDQAEALRTDDFAEQAGA